MRELTDREKNILDEHDVVVGNILNKDGSKKKMSIEEKTKYYNWLNACDFISNNGGTSWSSSSSFTSIIFAP